MELKPRKSFVHLLSERPSRATSFRYPTKQDNVVNNNCVDSLVRRMERLEDECIRLNKILTMFIDRIEELETNVEKLTSELKKTNTLKIQKISDNPSQLSTWERIAKFFSHRPSVETLKRQNIYKNEPCFDTEIENVIKHEEFPTVPKLVVECIRLIEEKATATQVEGPYRIPGNHVEIQNLRFNIDDNNYECITAVKDIHTIAGVLKLFFREIKSPLIEAGKIKTCIELQKDWSSAPTFHKAVILKKLVKSQPEVHYDTLAFFARHLFRLTRIPVKYTTVQSLAVSLTPSLFHLTPNCQFDMKETLKETEMLAECLGIIIDHCDTIFDL